MPQKTSDNERNACQTAIDGTDSSKRLAANRLADGKENHMKHRIELKKLRFDSADIPKLKQLNQEAFPPEERIEVQRMFQSAEYWDLDILGIYDNGHFIGFFDVMKKGLCAYIFYFAVCPEERSKGYGGLALEALKKQYSEYQIVVDFEAQDETAANAEQRRHRRSFYLRNGYYPTGYYQFYMNTEFEIACTQPEFNKEAFESVLAEIQTKVHGFRPHLYQK